MSKIILINSRSKSCNLILKEILFTSNTYILYGIYFKFYRAHILNYYRHIIMNNYTAYTYTIYIHEELISFSCAKTI